MSHPSLGVLRGRALPMRQGELSSGKGRGRVGLVPDP